MTNKYFAGNEGQWIYCDICGQPCYVWQATKLSDKTGRGGLIVCPEDVDSIDYSLIPYTLPHEKGVKWARNNHDNIINGSVPIDPETSTKLGS